MTPPTPSALLDRFYQAIQAADAAALSQCVHPEFRLDWQGTAGIPWAGQWQGVAGLLDFFATLNRHIAVVAVERLHVLANDDVTLVVLRGHWRNHATGKEVHAQAANVFTFADGLIHSYTVINNSAAFAESFNAA